MPKHGHRETGADEPRSDRPEVLQRRGEEMDYPYGVLDVLLFQMHALVQLPYQVAISPEVRSSTDELVRILQCCMWCEHAPCGEKLRSEEHTSELQSLRH